MKNIGTTIVGCFMCTILLGILALGFAGWVNPEHPAVEPAVLVIEDASHFDTRTLESWCGQPQGTITMVSGWYYEPGVIEDENGNLWGWDGDLEEDGFYLLWIDNYNTESLEDDTIVKFWKEIF